MHGHRRRSLGWLACVALAALASWWALGSADVERVLADAGAGAVDAPARVPSTIAVEAVRTPVAVESADIEATVSLRWAGPPFADAASLPPIASQVGVLSLRAYDAAGRHLRTADCAFAGGRLDTSDLPRSAVALSLDDVRAEAIGALVTEAIRFDEGPATIEVAPAAGLFVRLQPEGKFVPDAVGLRSRRRVSPYAAACIHPGHHLSLDLLHLGRRSVPIPPSYWGEHASVYVTHPGRELVGFDARDLPLRRAITVDLRPGGSLTLSSACLYRLARSKELLDARVTLRVPGNARSRYEFPLMTSSLANGPELSFPGLTAQEYELDLDLRARGRGGVRRTVPIAVLANSTTFVTDLELGLDAAFVERPLSVVFASPEDAARFTGIDIHASSGRVVPPRHIAATEASRSTPTQFDFASVVVDGSALLVVRPWGFIWAAVEAADTPVAAVLHVPACRQVPVVFRRAGEVWHASQVEWVQYLNVDSPVGVPSAERQVSHIVAGEARLELATEGSVHLAVTAPYETRRAHVFPVDELLQGEVDLGGLRTLRVHAQRSGAPIDESMNFWWSMQVFDGEGRRLLHHGIEVAGAGGHGVAPAGEQGELVMTPDGPVGHVLDTSLGVPLGVADSVLVRVPSTAARLRWYRNDAPGGVIELPVPASPASGAEDRIRLVLSL